MVLSTSHSVLSSWVDDFQCTVGPEPSRGPVFFPLKDHILRDGEQGGEWAGGGGGGGEWGFSLACRIISR